METPTGEAPEVFVQPTPNPNALKFVLEGPVKEKGSSTYRDPGECGENGLAKGIFFAGDPGSIEQVYFFENAITVNKNPYVEWEDLEGGVLQAIREGFPGHDPGYTQEDPESLRRENLSPDLQKIETILDRTVRFALQGDGGDIQTLDYENHILLVRYQGACGTCPSAITGTLEAIKGILRDEFDPELEIYVAPDG